MIRILLTILAIFVGLIVIAVAIVARMYAKFQGMCRAVRAELRTALQAQHPEISVVREWQGNLVLASPDRGEFVWPLSDVYTAVGALPSMGQDSAARAAVYREAIGALLAEKGLPERPPDEIWKLGVRPLLIAPGTLGDSEQEVARTLIPGLGLSAVYILTGAETGHYVTEAERNAHGLNEDELHQLALANLEATFPRELLNDPVSGRAASAIQLGDGFDASRLLLVPKLLGEGKSLVGLARHRDLLLLLPTSVGEDSVKMKEALAALSDHHNHALLLDRPVHVSRNGFRLV